MRHRQVSLMAFVAAAFVLAIDCPARADESRRPNILFMFTDDQPQICMGVSGNDDIKTPNMDRLARKGRLFNNAFVTTAICCSSRASILTGQYMIRHGIKDFQKPLSAEALDQAYPTLLKQAGYRTGYLGKFAVGSPTHGQLALPSDRFDLWYGFPQSINFLQEVDGEERYLTSEMTRRAIDFLRSNPTDQPFCLTLAFKEPHGPLNYFDPEVPNVYDGVELSAPKTLTRAAYSAEPESIKESLNGGSSLRWLDDAEAHQDYLRTFYRLITRADMAVGEILAELGRLGLEDNTVVIFSSDHGSMIGAHGLSGKWIMYEESIRVPMIVYDPRLPASVQGRPIDEMVLNIDIAPTILALAGVPVPDAMQGRSLMPLLTEEATDWRTDWYYEHVYNTNPPRRPIVKTEGVRTTRWKYTRYTDSDPPLEQLFDLENDPVEQINLARDAEHANRLSRLRARCDEYRNNLQ